jgi:hypothetical protein
MILSDEEIQSPRYVDSVRLIRSDWPLMNDGVMNLGGANHRDKSGEERGGAPESCKDGQREIRSTQLDMRQVNRLRGPSFEEPSKMRLDREMNRQDRTDRTD